MVVVVLSVVCRIVLDVASAEIVVVVVLICTTKLVVVDDELVVVPVPTT